jgi:WD40 repeat protein
MKKDADIESTHNKFPDCLVASTSLNSEEIQIWEPKSLSPYDPFSDPKFHSGQNTLALNPDGHIVSSHQHKNILNFWRWDKRDVQQRSPTKERITVLRLTQDGLYCLTGSKMTEGQGFGKIFVWSLNDGQLIGEVDNAHFEALTALEISNNGELVATGGADSKIRVWTLISLMNQHSQNPETQSFCDLSHNTATITSLAFSSVTVNHLYSTS